MEATSKFIEAVIDEMEARFPDLEFGTQRVDKLQGQSYTGMSFSVIGNKNTNAVINLFDAEKSVEGGADFSSVCDEIARAVENGMAKMPVVNIPSYDFVKERLAVQMVPVKGNVEMLATVPHKIYADLALVYRVEMSKSEDGVASAVVNYNLMETLGVDEGTLHGDALKAASYKYPAVISGLGQVIKGLMGCSDDEGVEDSDDGGIFVCAAKGSIHGASVIAYPCFLDAVANRLGGGFFILPSSTQEVLVVPDDGTTETEFLRDMVRSVNAAEVAPEDQLSNNVYYYDPDEGELKIAE